MSKSALSFRLNELDFLAPFLLLMVLPSQLLIYW
jgi:hypothetical protein